MQNVHVDIQQLSFLPKQKRNKKLAKETNSSDFNFQVPGFYSQFTSNTGTEQSLVLTNHFLV